MSESDIVEDFRSIASAEALDITSIEALEIAKRWEEFTELYKQATIEELNKIKSGTDALLQIKKDRTQLTTIYLDDITIGNQGAFNGFTLRWKPPGKPAVLVEIDMKRHKAQQEKSDPHGYVYRESYRWSPVEGKLRISHIDTVTLKNNRFRTLETNGFLKLPNPRLSSEHIEYKSTWLDKYNADMELLSSSQFKLTGLLEDSLPLMIEGVQHLPFKHISKEAELVKEFSQELASFAVKPLLMRAIDIIMLATYRALAGELTTIAVRIDDKSSTNPNTAIGVSEALGLPIKLFDENKRSIDLQPAELKNHLEAPNRSHAMYFPWHVYTSLCTSLNLGRNVILMGPPGCGKTALAMAVGKLASQKNGTDAPKLVTASPAWTSGDVIGRYFPSPSSDIKNSLELKFTPGVFLQAIEDNRWLIIDEMNRADIDSCFGELFTVLSGQTTELPFQAVSTAQTDDVADENEQSVNEYGTVRIVPRKQSASEPDPRFVDFPMGVHFRLIGTMNDADRSALHQMSFALLRRFDVIYIDAPDSSTIKSKLIQTTVNNSLKETIEHIRINKNKLKANTEGPLENIINETFNENTDANCIFKGLILERVVGIATMLDVIRFVGEALRAEKNSTLNVCDSISDLKLSSNDVTNHLIRSYVAIGCVISVFPQLDALSEEAFQQSITHIIKHLSGIYLRVRPDINPNELVAEPTFHKDSTIDKLNSSKEIRIEEFLHSELMRRYRDTQHAFWLQHEGVQLVKSLSIGVESTNA